MSSYLIALAVTTLIAVLNGALMYYYAKRRAERVAKAVREELRSRMAAAPVKQ